MQPGARSSPSGVLSDWIKVAITTEAASTGRPSCFYQLIPTMERVRRCSRLPQALYVPKLRLGKVIRAANIKAE